jgi:imidazolonepropionase-like amidohydrolase
MTDTNNFNYQQIYEDKLSDTIKTSLELPRGFFELSHHHRMLIEELIDEGARMATETVLDPEILQDTAALAAEMGTQLYHFANMIRNHGHDVAPLDMDDEV